MSVCLINLLLLGLINALIIKAIAMHWHNSIFLDQSIPHGQHARSEVFFWRSKVFSTLSRVARWYQQQWTKCTHQIAPIGPGGQKLPTIERAGPKMRLPVAFPILANLALLVKSSSQIFNVSQISDLAWTGSRPLSTFSHWCQNQIFDRSCHYCQAPNLWSRYANLRWNHLCANSNMDVLLIVAHSHNEATPVLKSPVTGLGWR